MRNKTAQQKQYEQVKDKFETLIRQLEEVIELMPIKGNVSEDCQRTQIQLSINELSYSVNGIDISDFTPNEYSNGFKLSYS